MWTQLSDMPYGRASHAAAYFNGKLYVCGGYAGQSGEASSACIRNGNVLNRNKQWDTNMESMPAARIFFALVPLNEQLLAIGGNGGSGGRVGNWSLDDNDDKDTVFSFHKSEIWTILHKIHKKKRLLSAAAVAQTTNVRY
jgi:hypothetical protein